MISTSLYNILEAVIGDVSSKIEVTINLIKTKHATDRQSRHEAFYISEEDILKTVNKAITKIGESLIFDEINIKDYIHIHDRSNSLNVISNIKDNGNGTLKLDIITVMFKHNFKPKSNTYSIKV